MTYIEEANELATHYPYSYGVCEHVYRAHGDKAEEILKVGAQNKLSGSQVMSISDFVMNGNKPINISFEEFSKHTKKESKLPRKFLKGWS